MAELREIVSGLQFPEGPIAMDDGSVVLVEIKRGTLSRVDVEKGTIDVVAECGGGPNGAAVGPDGAVYVCNNGGCFEFVEVMGLTFPGPPPASYPGRRPQRHRPVARRRPPLRRRDAHRSCVGVERAVARRGRRSQPRRPRWR